MHPSITMHLRMLAAAVMLVTATSSRAQGQSLARLGIAAGATAPVSVYASDKHAGYHVGLSFGVRVPATPLEFRIDGALHELRYSVNSTKDQILAASGSALLTVPTGSTVVPYLLGGVSFYNSQRFLGFASELSTARGWNAGGGARFELTDVTLFVEARYLWTRGDAGIRILPISFGVLI